MLIGSDFKRTTSWNDTSVFDCVPDSSQSISDGLLSLSNLVVIWTFDENGARERILNTLDESVFVIAENLLINMLGITKIGFRQIINIVDLSTSTSEWDSLTISLFASSDADDAISSEDLKRRWINTFLVNDDEVLVSSVAKLSLEINNLLNFLISEGSLRLNQFLSLLSVGPEETRVYLSLFVFERYVEAKDVAISIGRRQLRVSTSMVKDKSANKLALCGHLVLHVHNLNHVKINLSFDTFILVTWSLLSDGLNGINQDLAKWISQTWMNFSAQRRSRNIDEKLSIHSFGHFEFFQIFKTLNFGELHTINKDSGVNTVSDVPFSLSHTLTDEKDTGCGSITDNVILSSGGTSNHGGGRMLDLHLMEENGTVFGQLDLTSTTNKHLNGSLWSKVGFEHLLETFGGVDVNAQSLSLTDNIRIGIDHLK